MLKKDSVSVAIKTEVITLDNDNEEDKPKNPSIFGSYKIPKKRK